MFDSSSFPAQTTFATGGNPLGAATADINADGKPDLVIANQNDSTVSVLLNTTVGGAAPAFSAQQTFATGDLPYQVAVVDINADGKPDVVVANSGSSTVSVLLNTTINGSGTPTFDPQRTFATGSSPSWMAVVDINADGKPDVLVTNLDDATVSVLVNTTVNGSGTPTFATQQTLGTGLHPAGIAVADINADGTPDIVVANNGANTVSVRLNTTAPGSGTITFAGQQIFGTGTNPQGVTATDINADGKPDVVVTNFNSSNVSILRNTTVAASGTVAFAAPQNLGTGTNPSVVVVADINGDGKPDMTVPNYGSDTVSVLLNSTVNGSSTISFGPELTFATGSGSGPGWVVLVDLNADGKPEIVVSRSDDTGALVLHNGCVSPPLSLSPSTLPAPQVGVVYNQTLTASGGTGPYTFSATSGVLPVGLILSSAGVLSGTPTTAGASAFTITATDGAATGSMAYSPTIAMATPTTTLSATPSGGASSFGQSVLFTATISRSTATGTATFFDGATLVGIAPVSAGSATFTTAALMAGGHSLTAVYSGDANDAASTSTPRLQTVVPATTTTTLSPLTSAPLGQSITFTATVSPSTTPGTVTFKDGSTTLGTGTLASGSVATFSTSALTAGLHSVTAVYNGDANHTTSTSPALSQAVVGPTATALVLQGPTTFGQTATFIATLTPGSATGTVTFKDGGATLGTGTLVGGTATFSTTVLIAGSHSITVVYGGDASNATSTSSATSQTVAILVGPSAPADGQVGVAYTQPYTGAGGTTPYAFTVTAGSLPAGLSLSSAGVLSGTPITAGTFSFSIGVTDAGSGTGVIQSSVVITTAAPITTTTALAPLGATNVGQTATFTVTVAPSTATGTVSFMDGTTVLGTAPLSGGVATFSTTALTAGGHSFSAIYSGDANNATSTSSALEQTVGPGLLRASITTLVISPSSIQEGGTVVFLATVASSEAGAGTPSGSFVLVDNGNTLATVSLDSNGLATYSTAGLGAGTHTLTGQYAGDAQFSGSVITATLVVSALPRPTPAPTGVPSSSSGGTSQKSSPAAPAAQSVSVGGGAPPVSAPAPVAAPAASAPARSVTAPAPMVAPVVVPDTTTRFTAPLVPDGASADTTILNRVVVQPVNSTDFLAQIPAGLRIEITAANQSLASDASQAQLGSLGGGNAVRLAPPVDLQLLAKDIASGSQVALPDGALTQTYVVSLPVIAEPASTDETFTWLVAVQEDGQFLGYMRYPSTFDPSTNSLTFELTGQGLQTISVLPVILQPSKVQAFEGDVHTFSSPFKGGVDFGVLGPVWGTYEVLAPQVGRRIGILSPDASGMIWIDASGVGPAGTNTAISLPVVAPEALAIPEDAPATVDPEAVVPPAELAVVEPTVAGTPADVAPAEPEVAGEP